MSVPVLGVVAVPTALGSAASGQAEPQRFQCFDSEGSATGTGVGSQNYESMYNAYDEYAATAVTMSGTCKVGKIIVRGHYIAGHGDGPTTSATVTIYTDAGGAPGSVVAHGHQPNLATTDSGGTFEILLSHPVKLKSETYWVSVVANLSATSGDWEWNVDRYAATYEAMWENPGGGWQVGCTTWDTISNCHQDDTGRSLQLELWRTSK